MLTIYLIVIGLGFVTFLLSTYFENKNTNLSEGLNSASNPLVNSAALKLDPASKNENSLFAPKVNSIISILSARKNRSKGPKVPLAPNVTPQEELKDIKQALVDKLDQKCIKLERILEEKNKILEQMQKDLELERSHRSEFESLRTILQQQIDDLKAQNRTLKDEFDRILQENLRLQARLVSAPNHEILNGNPAHNQELNNSERHREPASSPLINVGPDEIIPANKKDMTTGKITLVPTEPESSDSVSLKNMLNEEKG